MELETTRTDTTPLRMRTVVFAATGSRPKITARVGGGGVATNSTTMVSASAAPDFTGRNFAYAFRLEDSEYRNKVEAVIECMKLDGRLRKLHEKWYGAAPDAGSAIETVYFGYGPPGFKGFDPTPHMPSCK